jgi:hypothetical protein
VVTLERATIHLRSRASPSVSLDANRPPYLSTLKTTTYAPRLLLSQEYAPKIFKKLIEILHLPSAIAEMPSASHPQAQFVPISPDLDLNALVENTSNFDYVTRLPLQILNDQSIQHLEQFVLLHVVIGGKPLVIENWGDVIDPGLFSPRWLQDKIGKKGEVYSAGIL